MRATISFDIGLDRVSQTMVSLVAEEANVIHLALERVETTSAHTLAEDVDMALEHLAEATNQLQQYRQMLTSFERAKFETIVPQPARPTVNSVSDIRQAVESMQKFDSFLSQASTEKEAEETEVSDDPENG
tara:strand:+ start:91 stop:483 length:393 start_codon:yes stop_codon:yes gene_type:complete